MSSQTISVKYIPNTSIDYFNTLLTSVAGGASTGNTLVTLHVEAFSCRVSRADKANFENQRKEHQLKGTLTNHTTSIGNTTYNGSTPAISYTTSVTPQHRFEDDDDFRLDNEPPASSQSQQNAAFPAFGANTAMFFAGGGDRQTPPTTPPLSFVSPSSGAQINTGTSISQSGRPCFPEYFVIPSDGPATNMTSASPSGMGTQQNSYNSMTAGGGAAPSNNNNVNGMPSFRLDDENTNDATITTPTSGGGGGMGGRSGSAGNNQQATNNNNGQPFYVPSTQEEAYAFSLQIISDRLIYLVGALNSLYGTTEYDFSVLEPNDFILVNPTHFIAEVNTLLSGLPSEIVTYTGNNGEAFWRAICSLLGGEQALYDANTNMSECDVFLFRCPSCDPTAQTKLWSTHYFVYHKKNKVIISVLGFGDGNLYKGERLGFVGSSGVASGDGTAMTMTTSSAVQISHHSSHYSSSHHHHSQKNGGLPTQTTHGEFYIDGEGNTHLIGGEDDDDDIGVSGRGGGTRHGQERGRGGGAIAAGGQHHHQHYPTFSPNLGGVNTRDVSHASSPTPTGGYGYGGDDTPQQLRASQLTDEGEWGGEH